MYACNIYIQNMYIYSMINAIIHVNGLCVHYSTCTYACTCTMYIRPGFNYKNSITITLSIIRISVELQLQLHNFSCNC